MRRLVLALSLLLIASACSAQSGGGSMGSLPTAKTGSMILIYVDDVSVAQFTAYDHLGLADTVQPVTTAVTALAAQGVLFDRAYTNPICGASRSGLLTGRHPSQTGNRAATSASLLVSNGSEISPEVTIFRSIRNRWDSVSEQSVQGAQFGKQHVEANASHCDGGAELGNLCTVGGDCPSSSCVADGADEDLAWMGCHYGTAHYQGDPTSTSFDFDHVEVISPTMDAISTNTTSKVTQLSDQFTDDAMDYMEARWLADPNERLLVILMLPDGHKPNIDPRTEPAVQGDCELADDRACFRAQIEFAVDVSVATVVSRLGSMNSVNRLDTTYVVMLGDNGAREDQQDLGELGGKSTMYNGGVHVPLIWAYGDILSSKKGTTSQALISVHDVHATMLDVFNATVPDLLPEIAGNDLYSGQARDISGRSILGLLTDVCTYGACYPEYAPEYFATMDGGDSSRMIVNGDDYKLVNPSVGVYELYDIGTDPGEATDIMLSTLTDEEQIQFNDLWGEMLRVDDYAPVSLTEDFSVLFNPLAGTGSVGAHSAIFIESTFPLPIECQIRCDVEEAWRDPATGIGSICQWNSAGTYTPAYQCRVNGLGDWIHYDDGARIITDP